MSSWSTSPLITSLPSLQVVDHDADPQVYFHPPIIPELQYDEYPINLSSSPFHLPALQVVDRDADPRGSQLQQALSGLARRLPRLGALELQVGNSTEPLATSALTALTSRQTDGHSVQPVLGCPCAPWMPCFLLCWADTMFSVF